MIPKNKPGRSKAYLDYIRSRPCCVCQTKPAEPHHTVSGGVGLKGSDFSCIPMCRECHNELGLSGIDTFQKEKHINIYEVVAKYTIVWLDMHCSDEVR